MFRSHTVSREKDSLSSHCSVSDAFKFEREGRPLTPELTRGTDAQTSPSSPTSRKRLVSVVGEQRPVGDHGSYFISGGRTGKAWSLCAIGSFCGSLSAPPEAFLAVCAPRRAAVRSGFVAKCSRKRSGNIVSIFGALWLSLHHCRFPPLLPSWSVAKQAEPAVISLRGCKIGLRVRTQLFGFGYRSWYNSGGELETLFHIWPIQECIQEKLGLDCPASNVAMKTWNIQVWDRPTFKAKERIWKAFFLNFIFFIKV